MPSPVVSVVGRVVILCSCVSCASVCSPEAVHSSGLLLERGFSRSVCLTPRSMREEQCHSLSGGRIAHRSCECDGLVTGTPMDLSAALAFGGCTHLGMAVETVTPFPMYCVCF